MIKVGDKVKLISDRHGISNNNPYNMPIIGRVTRFKEWGYPICVKWENGTNNTYERSDLIIIDDEFNKLFDEIFNEILKMRGERNGN